MMNSLRRALAIGMGYGLAAGAVDLALGVVRVSKLRMGPGPLVLAEDTLIFVALGALLGIAGAPLLR
jgi:hypothetical protein